MSNTSMNISLPEELKKFVRERVKEEAFSNPSDYVRALIRRDQKRRAKRRLEALLLKGLDAGPAEPLTEEDRGYIRAQVRERIAQRQQRGV